MADVVETRSGNNFGYLVALALQEYPDRDVCPRCGNDGKINGAFCDCVFGKDKEKRHEDFLLEIRENALAARQRRLTRLFGEMAVPPRFSDCVPETIEDMEGKANAVRKTKLWAAGKSDRPGIILMGKAGVGKSALGWWAVPQRGWGLWQSWPSLYKTVQSFYGDGSGAKNALEIAKTAPVLFLDDLGDLNRKRPETDDRRDILFCIVNHRSQELLPMFVTSNLTARKFTFQFGERITSRLFELCEFVVMEGIDLRRRRKNASI